MKIYNEDKTQILDNPDLKKGWLKPDQIVIKTIPATEEVEEQGHYVTIREYENGGKDVEWVVDVEGIPAKPETYEYENIQVYIPFTEEELKNQRLNDLLDKLTETDYTVFKIAEAETEEEKQALREKYAEVITNRKKWRAEINVLETQLNQLTNQV